MMTEETVENSSIFLADSPSPLFWPVSDSDTSMAVESGDSEPGPGTVPGTFDVINCAQPRKAAGDSESGREVAGPCRAAGPAAGPEPLSRLVDQVRFKFLTQSQRRAGSARGPEPLSRLADSDLARKACRHHSLDTRSAIMTLFTINLNLLIS